MSMVAMVSPPRREALQLGCRRPVLNPDAHLEANRGRYVSVRTTRDLTCVKTSRGYRAASDRRRRPRGQLRPPLRDPVTAHLRVERGSPESEDRGGRLLVPARRLQRAQDRRALDLLERSRRRRGARRGGDLAPERLGQVG